MASILPINPQPAKALDSSTMTDARELTAEVSSLPQDIYKNLRATETKKRPRTDFFERVQKHITLDMRAIAIDWLVQVAEELDLGPETLHLTVNYMDRYLSGNNIKCHQLQLLGATCMLIASKHEESDFPDVKEFCEKTDDKYSKEAVLEMEIDVLKHLRFELTAPTARCFISELVHVARGTKLMEFLANYISELSLLEYHMLRYYPSMIAAASVFLANYMIQPKEHPWSVTLANYSQYQSHELYECVNDLIRILCRGAVTNLHAIGEKYNASKYMFVAGFCFSRIPSRYFFNANN
ncbi:uncharacterized protein A4U43_C05F14280 [Asparagus officinalis]|uniref:Uncharacterized protein n=1 Tax=Asparagus officinalis TaxID=4686 RepID=A0A5P1ESL5_ASPOF|nr:cyclin-A1-1-like [Asparagus officinalis]ONK68643.1 uncharacterized protein A4U43_C05F14280 [Asparagus officinalis]